jgi:hypothetical protein
MNPPGITLLQIHYHNRAGGVATIMRRYADAFAQSRRAHRPHESLIVCSAADGTNRPPYGTRIVDSKDCDYRSFRGRAQFLAARQRIMRTLLSIIEDPALPGRLVVIGHNMNLGKNCALSSAFAGIARHCSLCPDSGGVRFFSVVHDFAEEGRRDLLVQIETVQEFGIDIWDDLYPSLPNLDFVTPHPRNNSLLKRAGFQAHLLRNPVSKTGAARSRGIRGRLRAELWKIAKKDNVHVDKSRPLVLYPSRIISRKNPVEAVLVAHVMFEATLLLGAPGASAPALALAADLGAVCRKHGIPVVLDAGRSVERIDGRGESFSLLFEIADLCMTTSIAEGFGYAIYEPALHGRTVIGRLPGGFPASEKTNFPYLYKRLLIPKVWVRTDILKRRYYAGLKTVPGWKGRMPSFGSFSRMFDAAFTRGHGIDFGCLDVCSQLSVLRRCVQDPHAAEDWKRAFPAQTRRLLASLDSVVRTRRSATPAAPGSFEKSFTQCYLEKHRPHTPLRTPDPTAFLRHFCRLENFQMLMTPADALGAAQPTVFA